MPRQVFLTCPVCRCVSRVVFEDSAESDSNTHRPDDHPCDRCAQQQAQPRVLWSD